ncbi:MAG: TetR/AcrR family transcriptional regulator [Candidatus Cloacimonetes bacterium]|nr:TetR/AcrR family transcriptional regulator [Candidatus Cloacimonadota bacterium]MCK9332044.1 TetR/AcrR family transcriptional regulator [Candidatus Cloacimonadota bacterium]MDD3379029.1 TetR/AcrR family transcriptional regulator [Candidatus Methanomethylophilaceae archaeon]
MGHIYKTGDKRHESSRKKILDVSIDLFYELGYEKTTTRQIVQRAGILNGSLYYTFANKEEIFKEIMLNAFSDALIKSESLFDTDTDLITELTFPIALELYTSSKSKRIAELLYQAHSSWSVLDGFVDIIFDWVSTHTTVSRHLVKDKTTHANILAVMGVVGNIIGEFANTDDELDYRVGLKTVMEVFCTIFKYPLFNMDVVINEICDKVESGNIVICGRNL